MKTPQFVGIRGYNQWSCTYVMRKSNQVWSLPGPLFLLIIIIVIMAFNFVSMKLNMCESTIPRTFFFPIQIERKREKNI